MFSLSFKLSSLELLPESCSAPATCLSSPVQASGNFHAFSSTSNLKYDKENSSTNDSSTDKVGGSENSQNIVRDVSNYSVESVVQAAACSIAIFSNSVTVKESNDSSDKDTVPVDGSPVTSCTEPG